MHSLKFGELRRVLCLGAHSDDIEIGCGGAILQLVAANPSSKSTGSSLVLIQSGKPRRWPAPRLSWRARHGKMSSFMHFAMATFPYLGDAIKDEFEAIKHALSPDLIFTHYRHDLHQDHRLLCQLTWNTFRDHLILEYEIPKWDGDLRTPNVYFPLVSNTAQRKALPATMPLPCSWR